MYGLNEARIIGHIGSDLELRDANGTAVVSFTVATNEGYKDQSGNFVERTEWHKVTAWRKLAEIMSQILSKGQLVYISGKLQTRKWEKDGVTHYTTEIVAADFMALNKKSGNTEPTYATDEDMGF